MILVIGPAGEHFRSQIPQRGTAASSGYVAFCCPTYHLTNLIEV